MPQTDITLYDVHKSSESLYRYDSNRVLMDIIGKKLLDFDKSKGYKKGDMIYRRNGNTFIFYKANKDISPGSPFNPNDWVIATDEDKTNIIGSGSGGGNSAPNPLKGFDYFKGYSHAERTKLGVEACVRRAQDYGISKYMVLQLVNDDILFPIIMHKNKKEISIPKTNLLPVGEKVNAVFIHVDYDILDKSGTKLYTANSGMGTFESPNYIESNVIFDIDYFGGYTSGNSSKKFHFRLGNNANGNVSLETLNRMLIQHMQFNNRLHDDSVFNEISKIDIRFSDDNMLQTNQYHFIIHNIFAVLCDY